MASRAAEARELPHLRAGLGRPVARVDPDGRVVLEIGGVKITAPDVFSLKSLMIAGDCAIDRADRQWRRNQRRSR